MAATTIVRVNGDSSPQKVSDSLAQTGLRATCFSTLSNLANIFSIRSVALGSSSGKGDRRYL
ncbi:hypothetical protein, partial [Escherichia coli]|uniref:hypothetical protein n=1 Tax=Escherichia coli TaxID=562 RepID=UPI00200F35F6